MISCLIGIIFYTAIVSVATHGVPGHVCPRHRGLPDGINRGENSILSRALYRIDLRHALKGYKPNQEYRLRVHTTARKFKFNDATLLVEALNPTCGAGTLLVQDDSLYSPQGCPDVVTTQQKEPMGRAHFRWQAPSCGCVHIRSRVHANGSYFLEDEDVHNGPLARTVCPKEEFLRHASEAASSLRTKDKIEKLKRSREHRLKKLCEANKLSDIEKMLKDDIFMDRRHVRVTNDFDLDRLNIALEHRRSRTLECCSMRGIQQLECFGDVRRRRIDTFCGTGEPEVPFSKNRFDWIKQRESDCCWQIGEARYTCFNYTMYRDGRPQEQRPDSSEIQLDNLDDFDPANDLEDFITEFDEEFLKDTSYSRSTSARPTQTEAIESVPSKDAASTDHLDDHSTHAPSQNIKKTLNNTYSAKHDKQNTSDTHIEKESDELNKESDVDTKEGDSDETVEDESVGETDKSDIQADDTTDDDNIQENDDENEVDDNDDEEKVDNDDDEKEIGDKKEVDDEMEVGDDGNEKEVDDNEKEVRDDDDEKEVEIEKEVDDDDNEKEVDDDGDGTEAVDDDEENSEEDGDSRRGFDSSRKFTKKECCLKGMTAGTIVASKGWEGCFEVADKLDDIFSTWTKRCDRLFVTCCMRAIDGLGEKRWR